MNHRIGAVLECIKRLEAQKDWVHEQERCALSNKRTKEAIELGLQIMGIVMSIRKIKTYLTELRELEARGICKV